MWLRKGLWKDFVALQHLLKREYDTNLNPPLKEGSQLNDHSSYSYIQGRSCIQGRSWLLSTCNPIHVTCILFSVLFMFSNRTQHSFHFLTSYNKIQIYVVFLFKLIVQFSNSEILYLTKKVCNSSWNTHKTEEINCTPVLELLTKREV